MKAIHLRTEYLKNPLGLGIASPKVFWQCEGGIKQTAYQIIAKAGEETMQGSPVSRQYSQEPWVP